MAKPKNDKHSIFAVTVSPRTGTHSLEILKETFIKYTKQKCKSIKNWAYALELGKDGGHPHIHILIEIYKPQRIGNYRKKQESWWSKELKHPITPNFIGKDGCKIAHTPYYYFEKYMTKEGIEFVNSGFDLLSLKKAQVKLKNFTYYLGCDRKSIHKNNFMDLYRHILATTNFNPSKELPGSINLYINQLAQYLDEHDYQVSYLLDNKKRIWDRILFVHKDIISFHPDG